MLSADTEFDILSGFLTTLNGHFDEFAYAILIECLERIAFKYTFFLVFLDDGTRIVSRETVSHLCKVIGTE